MPIDPNLAIGQTFSTGLTAWTAREIQLYHLALGAGEAFMDPSDLAYVGVGPLKVLPTFPVLATSGIVQTMITLPGLGFELGRAVHGEQEVTLAGPVPPDAEVINTARVEAVYDKGSGAVIVLEVKTRDRAGALLYTNRRTIFARGEGGFGGDPGPSTPRFEPGRAPDGQVETRTLPRQALLYAEASGERSLIHTDPPFARSVGFDGVIMHGLCTFGMVCRAIIANVLGGDPARVTGCRTRFAGPVYPGETLATSLWREDGRILFETVSKERGTPALSHGALTLAG